MERLTAGNCRSLIESYVSIYNNCTGDLQEQENIQEFLQVIDELVEEGYDLSEYTYDELYEEYLSEGGLGSVLKTVAGKALESGKGAIKTAWQGSVKQTKEGPKFIPGAKQTTKEILAKTGNVLPWVGLAAAADQALLGGKGREWAGHALQQGREAAGSIPSPRKPQTAKPQPSKPSQERNPYGLNQDFDIFDVIKGYLLDEGYAETEEEALAMMVNMNDEWRESIIEETRRAKYLQKKFNKENERKSGSAHTYIPGKQNTSQALQKARESERHMRGER
jgi:hypothetical protein